MAHCQDHGVTENFYQILMHKAHISSAKEAQVSRPILLHRHEFLQMTLGFESFQKMSIFSDLALLCMNLLLSTHAMIRTIIVSQRLSSI